MDEIDKKICEEATQGSWYWRVNPEFKDIALMSSSNMYDIVMDFVRYGMQRASPRFNDRVISGVGILKRADEYFEIIPGREHHAAWARGINHPDAKFIAHFNPDKVMELLKEIESLKDQILHLEKKGGDDAKETGKEK